MISALHRGVRGTCTTPRIRLASRRARPACDAAAGPGGRAVARAAPGAHHPVDKFVEMYRKLV